MSFKDQYDLSTQSAFQQRVEAYAVQAAINIYNEVANEVQSLSVTGSPTGGTFTLSFGGQTTAAINWNATAAAVQAALQALTSIGSGNVICTGGPFPGSAVTVTFTGTLASLAQNLITLTTNSLTGGASPTVAISRTTAGVGVVNHAARAALASKVLANPLGYGQLMAIGVCANAAVMTDAGSNPPVGANVTDAHIQTAVDSMFSAYA